MLTNYEIFLRFFSIDEAWLKRNTKLNIKEFNKLTGAEVVKLLLIWQPKDEETQRQIKSMEQAFFAKDAKVNLHFIDF